MSGAPSDRGAGAENAPVLLTPLLPAGAPAPAAEIVERLGLWRRERLASERPHVMLNMVASVDGRASFHGRTAPLSDRGDRELFHALRSVADAVLVGAGTVRSERYGRIVPDPARRALRRERGLAEEPLAAIVSRSLDLDERIPLLREPSAEVVVLTASAGRLPSVAARVEYIRAAREGHLDLAAALGELGERRGVRSVLCEGGPHLARLLLQDDLLDELFLTLAPRLLGGERAGGEALRILAGGELDPPRPLLLTGAIQSESSLFLRYCASARARVSRETIASSSLAS